MLFYLAYFFGGVFFANGVPHFVNGMSGRPFPTPFARPPGKGESTARLNVVWGAVNLLVGYLLIVHVGNFWASAPDSEIAAGLGAFMIAVGLAHGFGPLYGGDRPHDR